MALGTPRTVFFLGGEVSGRQAPVPDAPLGSAACGRGVGVSTPPLYSAIEKEARAVPAPWLASLAGGNMYDGAVRTGKALEQWQQILLHAALRHLTWHGDADELKIVLGLLRRSWHGLLRSGG